MARAPARRRGARAGLWPWLILGIAVLAALLLLWMGRSPICACGTVKLWYGDAAGSGTSQHLTDWYTPSHIAHGFIFYALLHLAAPRLGLWPRATIATLAEAVWEVAENTPAIIQRYREATIALGYDGDSVINSMADIGVMWLGFWLAARLPVGVSVAIVLAMEIFVGWMIRDNLALNVLMLLWPLPGVKAWQAGV